MARHGLRGDINNSERRYALHFKVNWRSVRWSSLPISMRRLRVVPRPQLY